MPTAATRNGITKPLFTAWGMSAPPLWSTAARSQIATMKPHCCTSAESGSDHTRDRTPVARSAIHIATMGKSHAVQKSSSVSASSFSRSAFARPDRAQSRNSSGLVAASMVSIPGANPPYAFRSANGAIARPAAASATRVAESATSAPPRTPCT